MYLLPAKTPRHIRVFSFGGGVQSVAVLVMQALGMLTIPYDLFLFANVGEDSESPDTLDYLVNYAMPFAVEAGAPIVELQKLRFGKPDTIYQAAFRENRSVPIPAYMPSGAPGNRTCTSDFKIGVVDRFIRLGKWDMATVGLGISIDEFWRAKDCHWHDRHGTKKLGFKRRREYPLLDARLKRQDCMNLIQSVGLPVPPKSSCFFCPFHSHAKWRELQYSRPDLFEKAKALEGRINQKHGNLGKDRLYLHSGLIPLENLLGVQLPLFSEMDNCESGYCHT